MLENEQEDRHPWSKPSALGNSLTDCHHNSARRGRRRGICFSIHYLIHWPRAGHDCSSATSSLRSSNDLFLTACKNKPKDHGQGRQELQDTKSISDQCDQEAKQFIHDATKLVIESAARGAAVHVSQSFSGSSQTSAIVVCLVACPEYLVLELQDAIDQAVERALATFPVLPIH